MYQRHVVRLTPEQRTICELAGHDKRAAGRVQRRALVLLHADDSPAGPGAVDRETAAKSGVDARTVARIRAVFTTHGFETALRGAARAIKTPSKLSHGQEARLLALLATPPPPGYPRWTIRTLAGELAGLEDMPTVSRELVRRTLKRHGANGSGPLHGSLTVELEAAPGVDGTPRES